MDATLDDATFMGEFSKTIDATGRAHSPNVSTLDAISSEFHREMAAMTMAKFTMKRIEADAISLRDALSVLEGFSGKLMSK